MNKVALYFHTLRHLKPIQIWGRFVYRLRSPTPDLLPAPDRRRLTGVWREPAARRQSLMSETRFNFLNEARDTSVNHEVANASKLWQYNLHYFDDLNAFDAASRTAWHERWLERWIRDNPPAEGVAWDPYPTSLRIVNWIKWALAGNVVNKPMALSLAVQARWLRQRLEWHLLGNHLFANAKALIFAGAFFDGAEAQAWRDLGLRILAHEIPEQILADGGHFERSTMYHALALEDMLDLLNVAGAYPLAFAREDTDRWATTVAKMASWLVAMSHPDGEISFFNDAAFGVAPAPTTLLQYAYRLGIGVDLDVGDTVWLAASGYVRAQQGGAILIADVAAIGPDYLPAHAHADTLSFELSIGAARVLVNSGTSRYGTGHEREQERATAAHNTLVIDGQNSSEVWAGFRVARRARPLDVAVDSTPRAITIHGAHDGYRRLLGRPVHRRRWRLREGELLLEDIVIGSGEHTIDIYFYFHPALRVQTCGSHTAEIVKKDGASILNIAVDTRMAVDIASSRWHPEFGISQTNECLRLQYSGALPIELQSQFLWPTN